LNRIRDLSGGEKQRVAIARGLIGHPRLVIADEPSSQLDSASAETVTQLLRRAAKEIKTAVLIATHDPRLHAIADRICQLRDGKLYE
jgi:putative ABC transport system ATP-binding protein